MMNRLSAVSHIRPQRSVAAGETLVADAAVVASPTTNSRLRTNRLQNNNRMKKPNRPALRSLRLLRPVKMAVINRIRPPRTKTPVSSRRRSSLTSPMGPHVVVAKTVVHAIPHATLKTVHNRLRHNTQTPPKTKASKTAVNASRVQPGSADAQALRHKTVSQPRTIRDKTRRVLNLLRRNLPSSSQSRRNRHRDVVELQAHRRVPPRSTKHPVQLHSKARPLPPVLTTRPNSPRNRSKLRQF